jgi:tRNA uridine 5-carbamoylmethylation protein Kti12
VQLPEISEQDAPVFPPDFVDVGVDEARRLVLEGQSILVLGIAGVGKTFWMKSVVSELRAAGKEVVVVAKTHCAVQNAEGNHTCNHFVHKYIRNGSTRADVIVIEEISQIDISIWCDLAKLALVNKQFLC